MVGNRPSAADYRAGKDYRDYVVSEAVDGPLVTSGIAARSFNVTGETVVNWAKEGRLPYTRGNQPTRKRWLIPRWAIDGRLVYLLAGGADVGADAIQTPGPSGPAPDVDDAPPAAPRDHSLQSPGAHAPSVESASEQLIEDNLQLRAFNDSVLDRLVEQSASAVASVSAVARQLERQHETLEILVRRLRQVDAKTDAVLPTTIQTALTNGG